jgi:uncharacterized membrane protein YphA (DoxX/SURF4 family)
MSYEPTMFADLGFAVFRIIVGAVFVSHAVPKVEDPESTREFFQNVGLHGHPLFVQLALGIEIIMGTMLAVGMFAQSAAFVLTLFMLVATYVSIVKMDKDFMGGYEVDLLLLGATFMFYLAGAGQYAVDAVLAA